MGTQNLRPAVGDDDRRAYTQALLRDLRALDQIIDAGMLETGVNRIGAEQELILVDRSWRPACVNLEVLRELDDPRFTTELGRFNIEFNADPLEFVGDCLARLERQLGEGFDRARLAARHLGCEAVMAGILPSLERVNLGLDHLTDMPRYHALNEALSTLRGGAYELRLKGRDELTLNHATIMPEAANTSFQVHFQVSPERFAPKYNAAQAATGPVLAAATNSPLLLGRRLWAETRIALFAQSIDTRRVRDDEREFEPRVSFGTRWVRQSAVEIFREDVARFRPIFAIDADEDPAGLLASGEAPALERLKLFNSTVYRWNRPCYGVTAGKPHLRIENRVLPAGPTPADQCANAAFWLGLVRGIAAEYDDIAEHMSFDHAHANFLAAAQHGLDAQLNWPGLGKVPVRELIPLKLLTLARRGLLESHVDHADAERLLHIIERRTATGQTGAAWMLDSLERLRSVGSRAEQMAALTAAISLNQSADTPVHEWPLASADHLAAARLRPRTVAQLMSTELTTVNASDVIDLALSLMDWQHLRNIPVEDDEHRLVGLLSHRELLRYLSETGPERDRMPTPVSDVMQTDVATAHPHTPSVEAMRLMRAHKVGCLPVVNDQNKLVGIVTEHDFFEIATGLLEDYLDGGGEPD
jgi:CBS domain-containing protein/gamma-glutamylcysteine synthetase